MHIPAPAPVPACQSELTKGAQWCVKIRNKSLERGHGGTWALRGGFRPSAAKLEPPDSGEQALASGQSTPLCCNVLSQFTHSKEARSHCRSTCVCYNWQEELWLNVTRWNEGTRKLRFIGNNLSRLIFIYKTPNISTLLELIFLFKPLLGFLNCRLHT